ncbi:CCT MOTIF FAMILY PROTEIN EXPRESSED [Salix koriyanagi]|uniref:CCT MOTIF FAMILY PROTEIN EXPRESSED n=1 Tax=Salix koriyanagi TaxID=2511006 RepID=A0A9Q0WRD6_9ROSI|nr:CCT MOTIF FAMILY PROTEIN EXPRESSED [Salix koriyanagi]
MPTKGSPSRLVGERREKMGSRRLILILATLLTPLKSLDMIASHKSLANAVGGKTARACDSCIKKRARWYCAADDAFLCQACDSSVHTANSLARRHERVRLKSASFKDEGSKESSMPSWHGGFTRKARTPRHGKPVSQSKIEGTIRNIPLVPEVGSDEISLEDNEEEHLLYRVPIFEPFAAELCTSTTISDEAGVGVPAGGDDTDQRVADSSGIESKVLLGGSEGKDAESLHGFLPSDMDLAEFAADMESLLGRGLENESFGMEELGLMDCKEENVLEVKGYPLGNGKVKVEEEEDAGMEEKDVRECHADIEIDMAKDPPFELSFDFDSPATCGEEYEKVEGLLKNSDGEYDDYGGAKKKTKTLLSLDYEAVMAAWASQGSPWTNGYRPDFDPDECWPDCMGVSGTQLHHPFGDMSGSGAHPCSGGWRARSESIQVQREAENKTVLQENKIRGQEIECREEAQDEREVC